MANQATMLYSVLMIKPSTCWLVAGFCLLVIVTIFLLYMPFFSEIIEQKAAEKVAYGLSILEQREGGTWRFVKINMQVNKVFIVAKNNCEKGECFIFLLHLGLSLKTNGSYTDFLGPVPLEFKDPTQIVETRIKVNYCQNTKNLYNENYQALQKLKHNN